MTRLLISLPTALIGACTPVDIPRQELAGKAMGTTWKVTVKNAGSKVPADQIAAVIEQVEAAASRWRADSFVTRFNRSTSTEPMPCPPDIAVIVRHALTLHKESGGAFDITVAPLVDRHGFGPPGSRKKASLASAVGAGHLALRRTPSGHTLAKSVPTLRIDLSAIAKGYAVDQVAILLDSLPFEDYLVEIGGELRARGGPWKIGIEAPDPAAIGRIARTIDLTDQAVATSGTYRLFEETKKRSHLIDPRTGAPVQHDCPAVTVIAETCTEADALATALMILGPEEGAAFAQRRGIRATFAAAMPID